MQRDAAKKLIKDTFERPFDKEQFTKFAVQLLNHMESAPFPRPRSGQMIFEDFRSHVASFDRVGKFTDAEGNKLDVLIVNLSKGTSLDRARATQRKFIARYLRDSQGGQLKDAALVAFVSPNEEDWRFSFVKMDYRIETSAKGKVKVKEDFTPARRYSFLVGKNENSHTAQSQLLPILEDTDHDPTVASIEAQFGIETVTREFFAQYRELYHKVKDALDKQVAKDKEIKEDFQEKGVDTVDFAKKLLGQIVFLYFLQKKGWFGVKRKEAWGTGSKGFLRELFRAKHGEYSNFFNDILEPLFYNTLAVERPQNYADKFDCKIPFLNGGLFDPLNNYDWVSTEILLPNELFSNEEKTKQGDRGTGILDVFDRYNFTVKEDEPLEKEVAVDPEMLGKVFENLLEVKDRKSKGTFYTPREIVHYMCQESLIDYLVTKLDVTVPRESIETLIKHGETAQENDTLVSERGREMGRYKYKLPESIRDNADQIDQLLSDIKVCDPAVGSGAFLVGMMSEIIRARMVLTQFLSSRDRTVYDLKRHAIQNSLYGVDIDLGAVEIAKLRLWLSLIVDEVDYKQIKPLPNLDYKVMQGNSLMEEYAGIKLIDESFFEKQEEKTLVRQQLERDQSDIQRQYIQLNTKGKLTRSKKAEFEKRLKDIGRTLKELEKTKTSNQDELALYGKSEARSKAEQLLSLHERFFSAYNKRLKDQLKEQIDNLTWDLIEATLRQQKKSDKLEEVRRFQQTNTKPFFLWKLNFADVFTGAGGFDIVTANPPYVSVEKFSGTEQQQAWRRNFQTFSSRGDIYCFFYEQGLRLLAGNGILAFISSNKFQRAGYGKALRQLLSSQQVKTLIDFCELPVFAAGTDPMIVIVQKSPMNADIAFPVLVVKDEQEIGLLNEAIRTRADQYKVAQLHDSGWSLEGVEGRELIDKLRSKSVPLSQYVDKRIYYGIKTGFNKAFVIDESCRRRLIQKDHNSAKFIRPWVRGTDIRRWHQNPKDLYIIQIPSSENAHHTWSGKGASDALLSFKRALPQIADHLLKYEDELRARTDRGVYFWELRSCAYWDAFLEPKIVFNETSKRLHAYYDVDSNTINKTGFIVLHPDALYILAILNSTVLDWYYRSTFPSWGDPWNSGRIQFRGNLMNQVPIPKASQSDRRILSQLADLAGKLASTGKDKELARVDAEIDEVVNRLFDLTAEEIELIREARRNLMDSTKR